MQGGGSKINFFEKQIEIVCELQGRLEKVLELAKSTLKKTEVEEIKNNASKIDTWLRKQVLCISEEIRKTRRIVIRKENSGEVQKKLLFDSKEAKIEELNDRLFIAEECVQKAELIKKANDQNTGQKSKGYEMSNIKSFKKVKQAELINKYIDSKHLLMSEIKRFAKISFQLMNQEYQQKQKSTQLQRILKWKASGLNYGEMREELAMKNVRLSRSLQKCPNNTIQFPLPKGNKQRKKPLIKIILEAPSLQALIKQSISSLINETKLKSRRIARENQCYTQGEEKKQMNRVRQYLQSRKEELTLEESVAKLELDAAKLNDCFDERVLALKDRYQLKKVLKENVILCRQWPTKLTKYEREEQKVYKSLQKITSNLKNKMKSNEERNKKNQSAPRTNDSLTGIGKRTNDSPDGVGKR